MEYLEGMIGLVEREFGDMVQRGKFRNLEDLDVAYKCMDIVKDAFCIMKYEEEMQLGDDYSEYGNNRYPYARGMNARRNSLGQFSREGNHYARGRSMGYSMTDAKEEFMNELYEMMDKAPNEQARKHIQKMIQEMEQ